MKKSSYANNETIKDAKSAIKSLNEDIKSLVKGLDMNGAALNRIDYDNAVAITENALKDLARDLEKLQKHVNMLICVHG